MKIFKQKFNYNTSLFDLTFIQIFVAECHREKKIYQFLL